MISIYLSASNKFAYFVAKSIWIFTRSNCLEEFHKKGVRWIYRKKAFLESFLNKVAGLRPEAFHKKRPKYKCFPFSFPKFLKWSYLHLNDWFCILGYPCYLFLVHFPMISAYLLIFFSRFFLELSKDIFK